MIISHDRRPNPGVGTLMAVGDTPPAPSLFCSVVGGLLVGWFLGLPKLGAAAGAGYYLAKR